jgi:hypothetical protein
VPNIHSRDSVWQVSSCPEEPVYFAGKWFNTDTTVVSVFENFAGCDSTVTMKLKVQPVYEQYIHDSICSDQYVTVNGVKYNQPLDNYLIMLKTVNGCDSAIYLTLTITDCLEGKCGENLSLSWTYNPDSKTLSISGNGALNSNYTYDIITHSEVERLLFAEGVTSIGDNAFANYSSLQEIVIPKTIASVGREAFYECTGMKQIINYRSQPCVAYSNTFDGIDKFNCTLYVPANAIDMYKVATAWRDFYYIEALEQMGIDDVSSPLAIQKILRNGQIFILRGEKVYTITGQEVK